VDEHYSARVLPSLSLGPRACARRQQLVAEFGGLRFTFGSEVEAKKQRLEDRREILLEKARLKGQLVAQKRIRTFLPFFTKQQLNIRDVRVLFDPVDYLAFRGLCLGDCKELIFIDHEPETTHREAFHKSLERTISRGNLEWKTVRIADDGTIASD
jgi:predicted Holliday junction resolvase-like endonuclease